MSKIVVLERDRFGRPLVGSVSVRTTFFRRKSVLVDGRGAFDKDAVWYFSQPVYGLHKWNLQGIINCCLV
jgi:hypothetical protein